MPDRHFLPSKFMDATSTPTPVTLSELTRTWWKVGWLSFGGPAGQIALMHRVLVDEKGWLTEDQYLHALSFCMLLPGPEAQQLATYSGWLVRGWRGGLIAGGLFILPGFFVILALSSAYFMLADTTWFAALFLGLKSAVLAIVLEALIKIARRAFKSRVDYLLAGLAFVALFMFGLPFPLIVLGAGLFGLVRSGERTAGATEPTPPQASRTWRTIFLWGLVWALPFLLILASVGPSGLFMDVALFFSQMALVTFGGAYAVLAYVAQQAVEAFGWLSAEQMVDGLALAETTPGPLVLVLTYVGFLAGTNAPLFGHPLIGGLAGATIATWVTFAPCFLWVFAGAPHIERLRRNKRLTSALSAITAAIVGVILNLAVWFALHVLFSEVWTLSVGPITMLVPEAGSFNLAAGLIAVGAGILLLGLKWNLFLVLLLAGGAGIVSALF